MHLNLANVKVVFMLICSDAFVSDEVLLNYSDRSTYFSICSWLYSSFDFRYLKYEQYLVGVTIEMAVLPVSEFVSGCSLELSSFLSLRVAVTAVDGIDTPSKIAAASLCSPGFHFAINISSN
jgi:hypothetical protein